jgi:hypothetical protein
MWDNIIALFVVWATFFLLVGMYLYGRKKYVWGLICLVIGVTLFYSSGYRTQKVRTANLRIAVGEIDLGQVYVRSNSQAIETITTAGVVGTCIHMSKVSIEDGMEPEESQLFFISGAQWFPKTNELAVAVRFRNGEKRLVRYSTSEGITDRLHEGGPE